ncbi:MAG: hypothetical protein HYV60_14390 [Planctomycetia bacterium]|nr:hypothetical protein [Planctomycetia bacterium]
MKLRHLLNGLLALTMLLVGPLGMHAAEEVVQQIPSNALAYVVVKNLQNISGEVDQTAQRMQLPAPNLLALAKTRLGSAQGVVETGDLALVLLSQEVGNPFPVIFVRTNDYDALLTALNPQDHDAAIRQVTVAGRSAIVAKKGNYAVFALPAYRAGLQRVVESTESVKFDEQTQAYLQQADAYAVATETGVKTLAQLAIVGLQQVKQQFAQAGPQGETVVAAFGMYEELFKWAAEEVEQVVVTLQINDGGAVSLAKRVDFRNPVELTVTGSATSATKRLARLPKRSYVIAMAGEFGDSKAMEKWMKMSINMMRAMPGSQQLTDEQTEQLLAASRKSMEGMRGMSFTFGVPEVGGSIYSHMGAVMEVQDANTFISTYSQAMQQMRQIFAANERMPYQILSVERTQVAGVPGMKVVMQISSAAFGAGGEQFKAMFDKMYGKDGKIEVYVAPVDDKHVALVYVAESNLQEILQAAKSPGEGLASDEGIQATAKLLSEQAQFVGYVGPEGMLEFVQWMMQAVAPAEQQAQLPQLPPFPSSPPLGFSFQYDGEALEAEIVAPAEFLSALGKYVQAVQQAAVR